ncbi:hypothetical protein SAMN05421676_10239 [Salinibacillus kushneri]|uniref:Uncharacterized protein n=1 Tax=Salinibacillus kushneri TaxID=237682 RepID=A0A1I0A560_9BACI|nr:hypothetical protein [Salinibacillus kushneri]SES89237.1 hypothetical protein SAMN05421676_10239 [Salinibacillus kushneri]
MELRNAGYFMHVKSNDKKEMLDNEYSLKCNAAMIKGIFVRSRLEYSNRRHTLRKYLNQLESQGIKNVIIHDALTLLDEDIMRYFIERQFNIILVNLYLDKGYCAISEEVPTDFYELNKVGFDNIEKIRTYKRIVKEGIVDKRLKKNVLKLIKHFETFEGDVTNV